MQYGAILKALRVKANLTQEQIAEKLNRSRSCISKYEKEVKVIDMPTFMQWIQITDGQVAAAAMMFGMDALSIINQLLPFIGGGFIWWM
ncbi:helix-turn-helix transcriptional regulator [Lysinibacillus mangiferihumi]|uniref:Helix-turn-helix transcriptional regulator n=1 Tax=Lysinibacillus mangiferihumi TaxID=1130819 RepID=A0A4U2YQ58_9BACI|nr:helix-turn-helix transcriptional regulator [Lysinibacillus mangiferihumi]TKI63190.1 helix-turn-helix transcriptional regulator [Lysinibacillus mangiferihumi]